MIQNGDLECITHTESTQETEVIGVINQIVIILERHADQNICLFIFPATSLTMAAFCLYYDFNPVAVITSSVWIGVLFILHMVVSAKRHQISDGERTLPLKHDTLCKVMLTALMAAYFVFLFVGMLLVSFAIRCPENMTHMSMFRKLIEVLSSF